MKYLSEPINVGNITLHNRLVMPPMATGKSSENGKVTENLCAYYDEKSKGGHIGLIITEHAYIAMAGKASHGQLSIAADYDPEGLKKLTDIIHNNGSKVFAQINHAGSGTKEEVTGSTPLSASAVLRPGNRETVAPKEMTEENIKTLVADFAAAAARAKEVGFDGAEIHSAHGYLLGQFYSPITNKRTDNYGGSLTNRIRVHLEVIKAIREAVGEDYPIAIRLGASDYMEGGATLEDAVFACKEFQQAGVDLLDISGNFCGFIRPDADYEGYFDVLTEAIKAAVSIPVILTGGVVTGEGAEQLLRDGKADLIGVGRAILKNSDWAKNVMTK